MQTGDRITWMELTRKGSGFRLSSKQGTISGFGEIKCDVKLRNGRIVTVETQELRLEGQETALTQMVRQMGEHK